MREHEGQIRLGNDHTSVLLVPISDHNNSAVRLVVGSGKQESSSRTLPEGRYRVQSYTMTRIDSAGSRWSLWGGGARGRTVVVRRGELSDLKLDGRVHVKASVKLTRRDGSTLVQMGVGITGDSGMGVTVVRQYDRVPARYRWNGSAAEAGALEPLSYG